ncbi:MAG: hypothetical protein IPQ07_13775 [Myxococcales bacterium]|nr:hypothetical protein [Myxococcales bacterium]
MFGAGRDDVVDLRLANAHGAPKDREAMLMGVGQQMDPQLLQLIEALISDLAAGRYAKIVSEGHAGQLLEDEIRSAVLAYGCQLTELPAEDKRLIHIYPLDSNPKDLRLEVELWTEEEGRSDLTLSLTATWSPSGYRIAIDDLHVL